MNYVSYLRGPIESEHPSAYQQATVAASCAEAPFEQALRPNEKQSHRATSVPVWLHHGRWHPSILYGIMICPSMWYVIVCREMAQYTKGPELIIVTPKYNTKLCHRILQNKKHRKLAHCIRNPHPKPSFQHIFWKYIKLLSYRLCPCSSAEQRFCRAKCKAL